jgi:hypothetical protein
VFSKKIGNKLNKLFEDKKDLFDKNNSITKDEFLKQIMQSNTFSEKELEQIVKSFYRFKHNWNK